MFTKHALAQDMQAACGCARVEPTLACRGGARTNTFFEEDEEDEEHQLTLHTQRTAAELRDRDANASNFGIADRLNFGKPSLLCWPNVGN